MKVDVHSQCHVDLTMERIPGLYLTSSNLYLLGTLTIGESGSGVTSLVHRFAWDVFRTQHLTIGPTRLEPGPKDIVLDNLKIRLANRHVTFLGHRRARFYIHLLIQTSHVILIIFDTTSEQSFTNVSNTLQHLNEFPEDAHYTYQSVKDMPLVLTGTKCDLTEQKQVTFERANTFAEQMGLLYIETSAKTGENVEYAYVVAASKAIQRLRTCKVKQSAGFFSVAKQENPPRQWSICAIC